nr:hypothetical protein [Tanacetum cinerariifolium]
TGAGQEATCYECGNQGHYRRDFMVIDKSWTSLGNTKKHFIPVLRNSSMIESHHISKYGFDPSYKTWIDHGELDLPPSLPVIDNTRQPQMSDMISCLNDRSYIPLNNKQNEQTQGDIGETSNDPTQAKRNEFEELYA